MRNALVRLGAAVLIATPLLTLALLTAPSAQAHSSLIASSPAAGSTVIEQPGIVELTFSEPVQTDFAQVAVVGDGEATFQFGAPEVVGAVVTQHVSDLPDGAYTISYRVVSADGHPVTGAVEFTMATGVDEAGAVVTTPPVSSPPVTPTESATPAGSATDNGLSPGLVAAIVAAGAVGVAVLAYLAAGGRRSKPRGDTGP
ncbi:MAG: copper resistance CopC family protein [Jiangellaceae bacterium]